MKLALPAFIYGTHDHLISLNAFCRAVPLFLLSFGFSMPTIFGQTDFAPGQIMFTGYDSDDADAFSIVLLTDVVSGTVIYFTDRGWDNSTGDGFRDDNTGEGTISFEFTSAYSCGMEIFFFDVGGTNDWEARNSAGTIIGTTTILTATTESPSQDADGMELGLGFDPDGDQLFIYQLPEPNPSDQSSFITAIHMNSFNGAWNGDNDSDPNSEKPSALSNNQVVRFSAEYDNAKYDCSPNSGLASTLQGYI